MPTTTVDLTDPRLWARPDVGTIVDGLRERAPVQRTETADDGPVWSVLSYELGARGAQRHRDLQLGGRLAARRRGRRHTRPARAG